MIEDSKYVIFNFDEVNKLYFDQLNETSIDTLRKSVDGTKTFVRYNGQMPSSVGLLTSKSQEYTYQEIINILSTEEWILPLTP